MPKAWASSSSFNLVPGFSWKCIMRFFISSYARSVKDGFFKARSLHSLSIVGLARFKLFVKQPNRNTSINQTSFLPGFCKTHGEALFRLQTSLTRCIIYEKIYEMIFIFIVLEKVLAKKIAAALYLSTVIEKSRLFFGFGKPFQASKGFFLLGY